MALRTVGFVALTLASALGCGSSGSGAGSGSGSGTGSGTAAAAPAAPRPPANPDGVVVPVPPGGTLADKQDEGGVRTWTYKYPSGEPREVAARLKTAIEAYGASPVVLREQESAKIPPPVFATFGARQGRSISANVFRDARGQVWLTVADRALAQAIEPPAGYPAGFPFLPFASVAPPGPNGQVSVVYNGSPAAIREEMKAALAAGGWTCTGELIGFVPCRKEGSAEIGLSVGAIGPGRIAVTVSPI